MVLGLVLTGFAQAAPPKPAIEVRLKAVSELAPIVKYVAALVQQEDAGAQYAGIIEAMAKEENGFDGALAYGDRYRVREGRSVRGNVGSYAQHRP